LDRIGGRSSNILFSLTELLKICTTFSRMHCGFLQLPFAFHGVINTAHEHTRKHVRIEQFKMHGIKCL